MKIVLLVALQLLSASAFGGLAAHSATTQSRRATSPVRLSLPYQESELDYRKRISGDANALAKYEAGKAANEAWLAEEQGQQEALRAATEEARLAALSPVERRQEMAQIKKEQAAAAKAKAIAKREEQIAAAKAKMEEALSIFNTKKTPAKTADAEKTVQQPASAAAFVNEAPISAAPKFSFGMPAAKGAAKPAKKVQPKRAASQQAEAKVETPSQLFERVAGSMWVPPSRPDLKDRLSSAKPAAKGVIKPTKQAPATAAPKFSFGMPAAKGAAKPAKKVQPKRAASQQAEAKVETPSQLFERVAGSMWVPPSRPDLKDKRGR